MPSDAELREMLARALTRAEVEGFTPETEQVFMGHLPGLLDRIDVLEKALIRLGSMEAFKGSRTINAEHDAELLARIDFARTAIEGGKP